MNVDFSQILIIIFIFLVFGTLITIVNLRSKNKRENEFAIKCFSFKLNQFNVTLYLTIIIWV